MDNDLRWDQFTPRTRYGYDGRRSIAVVFRHDSGIYLWALCDEDAHGVENTRDEAERKAEAAYRHARGLLGGVSP